MSKTINTILTAEAQIEINDMPDADITTTTLREQHDPNTAFAPPKAPDDAGEYECGANNKSAVTSMNNDLMVYIYLLLCFVSKTLNWHHIKFEKTIVHKTEGRCMHGFTRLIAVGHNMTEAQLHLLNTLQNCFMHAIYPSGNSVEFEEELLGMGIAEEIIADITAQLEKRAFNFLMKYGDRHLSAPIRVLQPGGEVLLNQNFRPLPYRPEEHVSEQVTVIAKGIKVDPDTVELALKTAGQHLEEKHCVVPRYRIGSQMEPLIEALRSQEPFVVTLHTVMYSDGTNSGWVVHSIDAYPQSDLLPEQNDN